MSTTFEVYPLLQDPPSFRAVLELATAHLRAFLSDYGIRARPCFEAKIHTKKPDVARPVDPSSPAIWGQDEYAWFYVPPIPGGTDAYCRLTEDWQRQEISEHPNTADRRAFVELRLATPYHWVFRRSVGQPAVINVGYGLLAAAFAELTAGILVSLDSAWEFRQSPATGQDFANWYFRPEQAVSAGNKEWAERCIAYLPEELTMRGKLRAWLTRRLAGLRTGRHDG